MTREEEQKRLQRLRDEIDTLKHEGLDHQAPKFKEWWKKVKSALSVIYGDSSPSLKRFETLTFRRRGDRMWGEVYDRGGKERVAFKEDLESARGILEEALEEASLLAEEGQGVDEEKFISSVSKVELQEDSVSVPDRLTPEVSAEEVVERETEGKVEKLIKGLEEDKKDLERVQAILKEAMGGAQYPSTQGKGLDQEESSPVPDRLIPEVSAEEVVEMQTQERIGELLQQLEKEVKDPGVALGKVHKTMEQLLRVKGEEALLQRLTSEAKNPKAPWGKIKNLMRGVWQTDKKLLMDILPELLEE